MYTCNIFTIHVHCISHHTINSSETSYNMYPFPFAMQCEVYYLQWCLIDKFVIVAYIYDMTKIHTRLVAFIWCLSCNLNSIYKSTQYNRNTVFPTFIYFKVHFTSWCWRLPWIATTGYRIDMASRCYPFVDKCAAASGTPIGRLQ